MPKASLQWILNLDEARTTLNRFSCYNTSLSLVPLFIQLYSGVILDDFSKIHRLLRRTDFFIFQFYFLVGWQHCFVCEKNTTNMNGICVWKYISLPNFHRLCVWWIHSFWYVDMPDVTATYGTPLDFVAFWFIFIVLVYFYRKPM